jgi:hypothetical protein
MFACPDFPAWYLPFAIGWFSGGIGVGGALIWLRHWWR